MKVLRAQWDRAGAMVAVLAGTIILVIGWIGVSGSGLAAEQIPYVVSCGVGGLFVLGIGAVLWLSADLRDEWHKLDAVENAIRGSSEIIADPVPELILDEPSAGPDRTANARTSSAKARQRGTAR